MFARRFLDERVKLQKRTDMIKGTIKTNKRVNQAGLVLIAISFLVILISGGYQRVWGKDYQTAIEVAQWEVLSPTPRGEKQDNQAEPIEPDMKPDNEPEEVVDPTNELAPMPAKTVKLLPIPSTTPSITTVISPQVRGREDVVPVNMSQLFAIIVVGMASLKLILVVVKKW